MTAPASSTRTSTKPSRLLLERGGERDLGDRGERLRERAARLRALRRLLEAGGVQAGHLARNRELDLRDPEAALDLGDGHVGLGGQRLRRGSRLGQAHREGHREAARVSGSEQLLGVGPGAALKAPGEVVRRIKYAGL